MQASSLDSRCASTRAAAAVQLQEMGMIVPNLLEQRRDKGLQGRAALRTSGDNRLHVAKARRERGCTCKYTS